MTMIKTRMVISHGNPMDLALKILDKLHGFTGTMYLSVSDARWLDEESNRRGDMFPKSTVKAGDTFQLWGRHGVAVTDDDIEPGRAYLLDTQ